MDEWQYHQDGRDEAVGKGTLGCAVVFALLFVLIVLAR